MQYTLKMCLPNENPIKSCSSLYSNSYLNSVELHIALFSFQTLKFNNIIYYTYNTFLNECDLLINFKSFDWHEYNKLLKTDVG